MVVLQRLCQCDMMTFANTLHCTARTHCGACRDKKHGRGLREGWARLYRVPNGLVDFDCPHGKPWGYADEWTPDQPSRGLGDTIAKVTHAVGIKPCGGCKERQADANERWPYRRHSHGN